MFSRPAKKQLPQNCRGRAKSPLAYASERQGAGISFAPRLAREVVLKTACSRMTLSMDGHPFGVSRRVTYLSTSALARTCQMEGQVADLKRRIPILKRLIAECDRLAADLDQEVRNEEDRVKIHDPAHSAYSMYASAAASRRDNLRRSADELKAHLAKAEKALVHLGEATLDA